MQKETGPKPKTKAKKAVSFRFRPEVAKLLAFISHQEGTTQTDMLEYLIVSRAKTKHGLKAA